jgi:hypothetical protein
VFGSVWSANVAHASSIPAYADFRETRRSTQRLRRATDRTQPASFPSKTSKNRVLVQQGPNTSHYGWIKNTDLCSINYGMLNLSFAVCLHSFMRLSPYQTFFRAHILYFQQHFRRAASKTIIEQFSSVRTASNRSLTYHL